MWSILRALPEALALVQTFLQKASVQETKQILRDHRERIKELDIEHDEDPVGTTRDFFDGGVRDSNRAD